MSEPAIRIKGLTKRFGDRTAVDGISLEVPPGLVFGLIGPNGAGKTTTFSILCGFLARDAGEVSVLGVDPRRVHELKGRLAALPQDAQLPPNDQVGALLSFYARLTGMDSRRAEAEARAALAQVGLSETWSLRAGALSHGMGRRVQLAQSMLLGSPEVMMLDEPTNGLDPKNAAQVREFIRQLHQDDTAHKRTVVISSHNLAELEELCDAAAILDHGRVVAAGSMSELTSQASEVRFQLLDAPPLEALKVLPGVSDVRFDAAKGLLAVRFPREKLEAEEVIGQVLRALLDARVRISGVSKGRKLEERVLELT